MAPLTTTIPSPPSATVARSRRGPVASGLADILPIIAAVAPFGVIVGVATAGIGVPVLLGLPATITVYGGSAHLATVGALATGTAVLGAALTGVLIQARLLLYSAGMSRAIADQPLWFRVLGSLTIIDQTYALLPRALEHGRDGLRRYWLTLGAVLTAGWLAATGIGMRLGDVIPPTIPVAVAPKAVFVAMLVPRLTDARMRRAVAVACVVAVAGRGLPAGLGIILALLAAMAVSPSSSAEPDPEDEPRSVQAVGAVAVASTR